MLLKRIMFWKKTAKIMCIIPTLNESATVAEVVNKARQIAHRVVVVDGHSEDYTYEIASKAARANHQFITENALAS